jgi:UDP-glucose 4-epimerase
MNNAVITGGAGFIASHLAEAITDKFDKIYLIDNLVRTNGLRNINHLLGDKFIFIEAEVSEFDFSKLENIKIIYHLAATRINRCAKDPLEGHKLLANAGLNVVKYCAENDIKLFFSSTASVYNNPKRFPIEETDPCEPHTIYGSAKYYTENLMRTFAKSHGLKYSICRFFSVYGVRMDCEGAYTEIIFNWLNQINQGKNKVTIFGNPDEKILDLVYVEDVINAILKSTENWSNEVYNVSTETGVSITELIKVIEKELGTQLEINILPENRTDIENKRVGSVKKLKELGWEPKNSLNQGILKTHEWIRTLTFQIGDF